jgi:myosin I
MRTHKLKAVYSIKYTVKKTTWQAGGINELRFISDPAAKNPIIKNSGKLTEIRVAPGLPKDSRPKATTVQSYKMKSNSYSSNRNQNYNANTPSQSYHSAQTAPPAPIPTPSPAAAYGGVGGFKLPSQQQQQNNAPSGFKLPSQSGSSGNVASIGASLNNKFTGSAGGGSQSPMSSNTNVASSIANKRPPPPVPPAKKLPQCRALYVRFIFFYFLFFTYGDYL